LENQSDRVNAKRMKKLWKNEDKKKQSEKRKGKKGRGSTIVQ
jgi:hypothetical protein